MLKCVSCDPLAERESRLSGTPQDGSLVTQCTMRVQAPPCKGRSDSLSPSPVTGPQRAAAGVHGGAWTPPSGSPVSPASQGSASDGVMAPSSLAPSARGGNAGANTAPETAPAADTTDRS